jgi:F-box and WD-40 domain protein CDC4
VVGLANSSIQTFDVRTGKRTKSLKGHTSGVWAVCLVEPGGEWAGGPEGDEDHDDWVLHSQSYADDTEDCVPSSPDSFEPGQFGEESRDMNSHPPPVSQMPPTPPRKPRQSPWYSSYELGTLDDPVEMEEKPSDMAFASDGWGQSNTIVVSGGCDKDVRVWELPSG